MNTALFYKVSRGSKKIPSSQLKDSITEKGILLSDGRIQKELEILEKNPYVDNSTFQTIIKNSLLERLFRDDLVIPEWTEFKGVINEIFNQCVKITDGEKSTLTPNMARENDDTFAVSICTIDGQILNLGDTKKEFCPHSCSKVLSYLLAVQEHGSEYVHDHVGKEPCGKTYKSLNLKKIRLENNSVKYIPHNPFIDSGAIMCSSMLGKGLSESKRFFKITETLCKATASEKIGFSHESFLCERNESDRRACMAFMMRELKSFPDNEINIWNVLELYFQLRSLEVDSRKMSIFAATLANGGVCPLNNELVFDNSHVRDCLSLMLSCGLYDSSGEWAFKIGLPAKSAICGCIIIAVPNKMGICLYSPKIDHIGNSVRGIRFAQLLVEQFSLHHLDNTREQEKRVDPCLPNLPNLMPRSESTGNLSNLMNAAAEGDLDGLRSLTADAVDLMQKNYDGRTALHIAASHGFFPLVKFLVVKANGQLRSWSTLSQKDRWGLTPLDVARRGGFTKVAEMLEKNGAKSGITES